MANSPTICRAVLDSNVLIAAHRSTHLQSPKASGRKYLTR